ncbi:MAG: hypothetical protein QOG15_3589 [Solirubrobacteraceae bacterium]|jgi:type II secretory pathway component PulM|nr:hypothetical protein [Solirubrobacteraceae bacterium]
MLTIALSDAEKYVAGAYVVFLALVLVYLAIMATKLSRLEREVVELTELAERDPSPVAERAKEPVG